VSKKINKTFEATTNLTTRGMTKLANSLRSCTRELARGGSPSDAWACLTRIAAASFS
jgi:hypothetical protein